MDLVIFLILLLMVLALFGGVYVTKLLWIVFIVLLVVAVFAAVRGG